MTEPDLERVEALFAEALELPVEARAVFLSSACGDDDRLASEVRELLEAFAPGEAYFDGLAAEIARGADFEIDAAARPQVDVGVYRAVRLIGHGGMGAVYLAERTDGQFDQQVALKLLHLDLLTPSMRARFAAERQLLARLSHPNIARLLDGGLTEEGRPFIVMEYVDGRRITDWCRDHELSVPEILRLFLHLVEAVSYLHRNLVVHRDLKPSNVLVDSEGHVRLLDFGIAKLLETDDADGSTRTVTEERLLTPAYAAPEQSLDAAPTTATDVYSLGVVLYELLTGSRPFDLTTGQPRETEAVAPSTRLRTAATTARPVPWRDVREDLDRICLMTLRPEPERRYASADQLGDDIERFLAGLPVRATKSTVGYRLGMWVRRHRVETVAGLVLAGLLAVGFARERSLRDVAEAAQTTAQAEAVRSSAVSGFLTDLLSSVDPRRAQGEEVTVADVMDDAAERLAGDHPLVGFPAAESEVRLTLGRTYTSLRSWDDAAEHLDRALELRRDAGDELARLEVIEAQGILAYRSGRREEAEPLLLEALEGRERLAGEDHPDTLTTLGHLANLYWYQERLDEAEELDRRTFESRERVLGPDHPDTLRAMNGLATTMFARADYAEAAVMFERALQGNAKVLGENHPDTLRAKNNLAATYTEMGRYPDAERLQWDVARGRARVLGDDAGATITSWHNLALTLHRLGRYEEAAPMLADARDKRRERGHDPSGWLFSNSFLGDIYRDTGRYEEAEARYEESLEGQTEHLGADHQQTLRTQIAYAQLELLTGRLAEAEARVLAVRRIQEEQTEPGHPDRLASASLLARIRLDRGRPTEALEIVAPVADAGERLLGAEHPSVEATRIVEATILAALGDVDEARRVLQPVLTNLQTRLGADHPATAEAAELMSQL